MAKNLVIVESPTKAKTIEKYLGSDYKVMASVGHVRDLPRSDFAVDVEGGDVSLRYEVPKGAAQVVSKIKKEASDAERVFLATDLDREGEAIAWHVAEVAGIDTSEDNRVVFAEITKDAILQAFDDPRAIDDNLVDAQQARRAVDRIVGYRLSPTLWRNVSSGISAGRVQSVALRLICDREDEIRAFNPREYWTLDADFAREGATFTAGLHSVDGKRLVSPKKMDEHVATGRAGQYLVVDNGDLAHQITDRARAADGWTITGVTRRETKQNPKPPFTTSTLQIEAGNRLGFSAARTMQIAQQLYEGIDVGSDGLVGLITYMRTDSVNLSGSSMAEASQVVVAEYGERYTLSKPRTYKSKSKGAQEAHEAIRPTSMQRLPGKVARRLNKEQLALYELIWRRTIATQMAPAVMDNLRADVIDSTTASAQLQFRITGQVVKFDGFRRAYGEQAEKGELPDLADGQQLELSDLRSEQHFTEPPPRYNQGSLVELLEAEGIGRPSTYASIIATLLNREYVRMEGRRFLPTPLGEVVVAYLKQHFAEVVDVNFTARMEEELDDIARGEDAWGPMVSQFLDEVDEWIAERKPERPRIPIPDAECPECGSGMQKVFSGKSRQWFASCERWPDCKGTLPLDTYGNVTTVEELQPDESVRCPVCGKAMIRRDGRYGPFYGCVDYPNCKGIVNVEQRIGMGCPKCRKGELVERMSRYGKPFYACNQYPDCDFALWTKPLAQPCPVCGGPLKPPRKNAKNPVGTCAHCGEKTQVEADPPRVETAEWVPRVEQSA